MLPPPNEQIFNFTGGPAFFTVPAGVTSILIDVTAPKGGNGDGNAAGGNGGRAQARVSLAPGTQLAVLVGGPVGRVCLTQFIWGRRLQWRWKRGTRRWRWRRRQQRI